MGLDMYIFKHQAGRESISEQYNKLEQQIDNQVDGHMNKHEEDITQMVNKFVKDHSLHIRQSDRTVETIKSVVWYFICQKDNKTKEDILKAVQWNLFNNCSTFNWDVPTEIQEDITTDFYNQFIQFCTLSNASILNEFSELDKQLSSTSEEVAYWRKHRTLNEYILESLTEPEEDGNCENLPLSLEDIHSIIEFLQDAESDTKQIQNIIDNWDESATYIYHPWW